MTYTITNNPQFNSIEIAFDGKPSEAVRDALKTLRFRWHQAKKIWYGYADADAVAKAIGEAEQPLVIPPVKIDNQHGYYDGWTGGKARTWRTDKELKAFLLSDFKKAGIKATVRFHRAGYLTALTVTVSIPRSYIKPIEQYEYTPHAGGWVSYIDENGTHKDIHGQDYLCGISAEERERLAPLVKEYAYNCGIRHIQESNTHSPYENGILTDEGQKILDTVKEIVTSYNSDHSDSMTDYFDRAIYDDYAVKFTD